MSDRTDQTDHRRLAVDLFNATWDYLDDTDRSAADDLAMLGTALGSWHHWRQVGTPRNHAISDWQVSRVFAVLGDARMARRFAQANLALADEYELDDFIRAYAHEALARAAAVAGDDAERDSHLAEAREFAARVDDEHGRDAVLSDLATV